MEMVVTFPLTPDIPVNKSEPESLVWHTFYLKMPLTLRAKCIVAGKEVLLFTPITLIPKVNVETM